MEDMAILYVISNLNMNTVELVASCLKTKYDRFSKIVFFESKEAEQYELEQVRIYRKYFGDFEKTVILLNEDGGIPADRLSSAFASEGRKVIDLSNGPKITTASLYLAAALCRIEEVYCLVLHAKPSDHMEFGKDYDYLKLRQIEGFEQLAKYSYFDLVYYIEDVNSLITIKDKLRSTVLKEIFTGMNEGIAGFFTGTLDPRAIINCITIGNEAIISHFLNYLRENQIAQKFAAQNNINLYYHGDPIGVLSKFFKIYMKTGQNQELVYLCTVPGLLSGLREYRNISAHYSNNNVIFTDDNVRTVINMQLEVLKCVRKNENLWERL